jgi:hypothetical protein
MLARVFAQEDLFLPFPVQNAIMGDFFRRVGNFSADFLVV